MNKENEKGVILVLCVILLPAIVMMLALAIDLGMFFLHRAAFQQAADSSTLSVVPQFANFRTRVTDTPNMGIIEEDFKNIKPFVLAMLEAQTREVPDGNESNRGIRILSDDGRAMLATNPDGTGQSARFIFTDIANPDIFQQPNAMLCRDSGSWNGPTGQDYVGYNSNCVQLDNMILQITRGVRCYDQNTQIRFFCSLEDLNRGDVINTSWEWANAVLLRGRVNGVASFFARAFMDIQTTDMVVSSISYLPENPPICGQPLCQEVFNDAAFDPASNQIPGVPEGNLNRCWPILGL
jgi:hypothetical protein